MAKVKLSDVLVDENFEPIGMKTARCKQPRPDTDTHPVGDSLTKQSFSEESDVNAIMRKYMSSGTIPRMTEDGVMQYGDFASGIEYHEAMTAVRNAEMMFQDLPIEVRVHCEHDPARLLDLVYSDDPAKQEIAEKFGLIKRKKVADPPAAEKPAEKVESPVSGEKPKA